MFELWRQSRELAHVVRLKQDVEIFQAMKTLPELGLDPDSWASTERALSGALSEEARSNGPEPTKSRYLEALQAMQASEPFASRTGLELRRALALQQLKKNKALPEGFRQGLSGLSLQGLEKYNDGILRDAFLLRAQAGDGDPCWPARTADCARRQGKTLERLTKDLLAQGLGREFTRVVPEDTAEALGPAYLGPELPSYGKARFWRKRLRRIEPEPRFVAALPHGELAITLATLEPQATEMLEILLLEDIQKLPGPLDRPQPGGAEAAAELELLRSLPARQLDAEYRIRDCADALEDAEVLETVVDKVRGLGLPQLSKKRSFVDLASLDIHINLIVDGLSSDTMVAPAAKGSGSSMAAPDPNQAPLEKNRKASVLIVHKCQFENDAEPPPWKLRMTELVNWKFGNVSLNLCKNQPFASELVVARCPDGNENYCSGWIVGKDTVVTERHCVAVGKIQVSDLRFVLDYSKTGSGTQTTFNEAEVYGGTIQAMGGGNEKGWAIVKLHRLWPKTAEGAAPVELKREPAVVATHSTLQKSDPLYMIGYPMGLPAVHSWDGHVFGRLREGFLYSTLDAFQGNSGSMVVNAASHQVEGIAAEAATIRDIFYDRACNAWLTCTTNPHDTTAHLSCKNGQGVTRVGEPELAKALADAAGGP